VLDGILAISSLGIPLTLGWGLLSVLMHGKNPFYFFERIFIALGLGWGMITLSMFYMSMMKINFSPVAVVLFAFALFLLVLTLVGFKGQAAFSTFQLFHSGQGISPKVKGSNEWRPVAVLLMFLISFTVCFVFFRTLTMARDFWDHWAVWGFKSKIYFIHQMIPFEKFSEFRMVWGNWDYPHHVPLMETWIFLWLGYWNDQWSRMIYPLFYLGLLICLYAFFRRTSTRTISLLGIFFR